MSGRKASEQDAIKENYKEERLGKWHNHFNNLLCKARVLKDEYTDDDVTTIYSSF